MSRPTLPKLLILCSAFASFTVPTAEVAIPQVRDPELEISLIASEPQIVTPIGLAIDSHGRPFVVESHTHQPKPDYPGPKTDQVKLFSDQDGDRRPETISIFAEGLQATMNLAFSPQQELFASHRRGVVVLHDKDRNGVSEARTTILELQTDATYPHNGLDGLAFSPEGWLYVGLGENLGSAYTVRGTDHSQHTGGGEGGSVFRCRPDGSQVQFVATGFWNPFALEFDQAGRLFCVDNDPDGRPPCRLLHVIEQGDYGYKFRYGRSGQHPFVAWDGELPGTLPMIAGTGEAPSGILECRKAKLPARYEGHLLVTSWGDNSLELYHLKRNGASFRAEREIVVQGDKSFRPVGIAAGPDGAIYVTDWADQAYPVHQKGRVWRLAMKNPGSAKPGSATAKDSRRREADASANATREVRAVASAATNSPALRTGSDPADEELKRLLAASFLEEYDGLMEAMVSDDPFVRSAALAALAKPVFLPNLLREVGHANPAIRLSVLLALRRGQYSNPIPLLTQWLADPDERVRRMALVWVGEGSITSLSGKIEMALNSGSLSSALFHAYLAAADILASGPETKKSVWDQGATGPALIERLLRDDSKPAGLRALALALAPKPEDTKSVDLLEKFLWGGDPSLQIEAVRSLALSSHPRSLKILREVALDRARVPDLRAEAVLGLASQITGEPTDLFYLLDDSEPSVQVEAARALRPFAGQTQVRGLLAKKCTSLPDTPQALPLKEQLKFALELSANAAERSDQSRTQRPASDEEWLAALKANGDPAAGRRVFFSAALACAKCHRVQGRGGQIGPDLSAIGLAADRQKLIHSILNPSQEIGPQFVQYHVATKDGQDYFGLLAGRAADGTLTLITSEGSSITVAAANIATVDASKVSLMPEGLEQALTVRDFCDLLLFLLSLK